MGRNTVEIPMANGESLVWARFRSRPSLEIGNERL